MTIMTREWRVDEHGNVREGPHLIAAVYDKDQAPEIAAVPDLVALAVTVRHVLRLHNVFPSLLRDAERAIAKAKGE